RSPSLGSTGLGVLGHHHPSSNLDDSSLPPTRTAARAHPHRAEQVLPRSRARHGRHRPHRGHRRRSRAPVATPALPVSAPLHPPTPGSTSGSPATPPAGSGTRASPLVVSAGNSGMLVTGPDAGGQPLVKVFDAATQHLRYQFQAYAASFHGGVRVAVADVNGDGTPDVVTGPGQGGGSQGRGFSVANGTPFAGALGGVHAVSAVQ